VGGVQASIKLIVPRFLTEKQCIIMGMTFHGLALVSMGLATKVGHPWIPSCVAPHWFHLDVVGGP
jgi:hypothetical protein